MGENGWHQVSARKTVRGVKPTPRDPSIAGEGHLLNRHHFFLGKVFLSSSHPGQQISLSRDYCVQCRLFFAFITINNTIFTERSTILSDNVICCSRARSSSPFLFISFPSLLCFLFFFQLTFASFFLFMYFASSRTSCFLASVSALIFLGDA